MNLQQTRLTRADANNGPRAPGVTPLMSLVVEPRGIPPQSEKRQFVALGGQRYVTRPYGAQEDFQVDVFGESVEFSGVSPSSLDLDQIKGLNAILSGIIARSELEAAREREALELSKVRDEIDSVPSPAGVKPPFLAKLQRGVVGIYDQETGESLALEWTGICRDVSDPTSFWYIGRCGGERSFNKLMAREYDAASDEAQSRGLLKADLKAATVLVHKITSEDVLEVLRAHALVVVANTDGQSFSEMAEDIFDDLDLSSLERRALVAGERQAMQAWAIRDEIAVHMVDKGILMRKLTESLEGFSCADVMAWLRRAQEHNPRTGHQMDCESALALRIEFKRRNDVIAHAMLPLQRAAGINASEVRQ